MKESSMSDERRPWEQPTNVTRVAVSEAGKLAKKHNISLDRAQMLIDRLGNDPLRLDKEAENLSSLSR